MSKNIILLTLIFIVSYTLCFGQQIYIEEDSDISERIRKLQELIESGKEATALDFIKSLQNNPENKKYNVLLKTGVYVGFNEACKQLILKMSPETKKIIAMEHNSFSKLLLKQFDETGQIKHLEKIISEYYLSNNAKTAMELLVANFLEQGKPETAIFYLNKLKNDFPETDTNGIISLKIVVCNYFLGESNFSESISKTLLEKHGSNKILFMGRDATIAQVINEVKSQYNAGVYQKIFKQTGHNWYENNSNTYQGKIQKLLWRQEIQSPGIGPKAPLDLSDNNYGFFDVWKDNVVVNTGHSLKIINNISGKLTHPEIPIEGNSNGSNCDNSCLIINDIAYARLNAFKMNTKQYLWRNSSGYYNNRVNNNTQAILRQYIIASAPVYNDGVLYYEAFLPNNILPEQHIIAIDAATGKLIWKRFICAMNIPQPNRRAFMMGKRTSVTYKPPYIGNFGVLVNGNNIYFSSEFGMMGTIKRQTGEILWLRKYTLTQPKTVSINNNTNKPTSKIIFPLENNIPILYGNNVIFAPKNSKDIFWFDQDTGKLTGEFQQTPGINQQTIRYVLGIYNGRLIVYGENFIELDAQGSKICNMWGHFGIPTGMPLLSGDYVYLPIRNKIIVASLKDKKDIQVFEDLSNRLVGHLSIKNNILYSHSSDNISAYQLEKSPTQSIAADKRPPFKPNPKAKPEINRIGQLIYNLGAPDFKSRNEAYSKLIRMGPVIFSQLADHRSDKDYETNSLVHNLLTRMGHSNLDRYQSDTIKKYYENNQRTRSRRYYYRNYDYRGTLISYGISIYPYLKKSFETKTESNPQIRVFSLSVVEGHGQMALFAVPDIINVLKIDPDNSVKAQAYKTLRAITGQSFPQNQIQQWEAWYDQNKP